MNTTTTEQTSKVTSDLFDQAIETFEAAMKAGAQVQEESTRWCAEFVAGLGSPQEWQRKSQTVIEQVIPATQKNVEEALKTANKNARTSLELLNQALATARSDSVADAQARTYEVWESALGAARKNTESIVQANARLMESYAELLKVGAANVTQ